MNASRRVSLLFFAILVTLFGAQRATAQCVSLTTLGSAYTQNFDTLSNVAGSTTNNLTITGWFMTESGGGARDNEQYAVDTGGSTTGDTYSYGAAAATDRALGALRSGTLIPIYGACFTNNTGATLTSLNVGYTGEEWRLGTAARTDQVNFEYSTNATDLVTGTWTGVAGLNFVTPDTVTAGTKNGNAAADRTVIGPVSISALSIANGATFWIRYTDTDATGADDGLSVDDFSLTPQAVAAINLTVNDVSLNEGNAGTTSFTFTVSLSAPAGPGGVTFDIATADGTATQPSDYTQKSLTGQTIPAGSSTYSFTVLVNGDTTPEVNETFLVNVTNVTGATVTDGQGQGTIVNDDAAPNLTINDVSLNEGNAGTTTFTFTVSLSAPAPAGGVTFDIATANGTATQPSDYTQKSLTGQTIPAGSSTYTFDVLVNGDVTSETDETFFVNISNITNAIGTDVQGLGTIVNDDLTFIHDVQGNGASTPIPGSTVTVEGVVTTDFQGTNIQGFFLQEEDSDADADPATSEGIFIFCGACPTPVAEGQRVKATGTVSEFNLLTEITASTAPSVVVTNAGNNLAQVTPATIDLPIAGVINDYYEAREGMKVTYADTLTVSEYFELGRYGQIILYEGGRPRQFTEFNTPSVAGNAAWADTLARRQVILDDDNNAQQWYLATSSPPGPADGLQYVYYPRANGGLSVGTQGTDFFRGGDLVNGLTGVLHWSFAGQTATDAWRIRPTAANPATFTVANPRPATPPAVGGAIHIVGMNLLNYFTTIDTTASTSTGPCSPSNTLDCRGADSTAELNRQRARAALVVCTLNADIYGFAELENTTPSASITDLLGAVNASCGGAHPYTFVNTGGTLGTDAIRVQQIYRTGIVSPVGSPLSDLDPIHSRPPTAQTYDVVDAANPAFGQRFTVIINHFKSKGSSAGLPGDADIGDGAGASNATRTAQANRLLSWINSTVLPAAGDPDVILLGDFNSYAKEDPINALIAGGYTDLETAFHGANAYSYLFDGQLGHLDYGFASASMVSQVTGADAWHINADEVDLFDYNDEIRDSPGESQFEEKPDGSALVPPRVVFQPGSPYRASDHDPVTLGIFAVADLVVTKTDSPDPVNAGTNLTYTITITNNGPDAANTSSWSDTLPAGTTFVSLSTVAGWSCTTPSVGGTGTVSCSNPSFGVGNAVYTLVVAVNANVASGTVLSNTATVTSAVAEGNPGNESDTETTTVSTSANLTITKSDSPDPVDAGSNLTYTINVTNNGPSNAATVSMSDTLPAGTTFVSLASPGGWSCTSPAVGATGTVSCTIASLGISGNAFTLVVKVGPTVAAGTVISNTATVSSATSDPSSGDESATSTTTVSSSADVSVTKVDTPDPVNAGNQITYTITVNNAGPSNATSVTMTDAIPAGTTFAFLAAPGAWVCPVPAASGPVVCTHTSLPVGTSVFTIKVIVDPATAAGTVLTNTVTVTSASDPTPGNDSDSVTTTVANSADLSVTKVDTPDPVNAGNQITYTVTVTNAGPSNATSVTMSDAIPAGTTFAFLAAPGAWVCPVPAASGPVVCTHSSLPVGTSVFTIKVIVDPATAAGTVLTNNVTVSSASDPNSGNNTASATTTVANSADVSVTKVDTPDPVTPGNNLTYTITVNNAGPSNASTLALADTLPANTTFVSLASPGGWSCTTPAVGGVGTVNCTNPNIAVGNAVFTLTVNVNASTAAGTIITNTANVTSATSDPNTGNESSSATTTVGAASADLSVTKVDTPDPVTAGTNLTYTITVNNAGPSNAATVSLADTLPANTTFVSLSSPGGWSCTTPAVGGVGTVTCTNPSIGVGNAVFTLTVAVNAGVADGTVITNTATVSSATADPNSANQSGVATTTVGSGSADLSVTKTDTPDPVVAGNNITYTITVTNAGPSNATSASLSDTVPANTTFVSLAAAAGWSCTTPAVGGTGTVTCTNANMTLGSAVFTLTVNVNAGTAQGSTITNTATATSATTDANGGDNSATATTTVNAEADLSVTKVDTPDPVTAGTLLSYTITFNNAGPSNAAAATLSDTVPAGTTFVSMVAPAGWTCTTPAIGGTGLISCGTANAAVGNAVFTLVVNVGAGVANGTVITNTATADSNTTDLNAGNDSGTATTTVGASADLSITKTDTPDPVIAGSNVTYTITVANAGPSNASLVLLNDTLPANTTFVSLAAAAGWSCTTPAVGAGGLVSCNIGSLGITNAVFTLTVTVDGVTANGTVLTNTALISSATGDPNTGNNSSTATTTVSTSVLSADLSVTKTDSPDPVTVGTNLTYTITVNNAGPDAATAATLSDTIPANTTFVSLASAGGWTCTTPAVGGTGAVSCSNPSMAVGSAVFTLVVKVDTNASAGTVLSNTATVASASADPNTGNESDTETTAVLSPATLTATKSVSGTRSPGGTVTYTVVISNAGPGAQSNNPGNEMTDVLPSQLTLVSATANSGTAVANVGTNTVTWNGSIPAGGSVTITIQAVVKANIPVGTTVTNQASISFDADGNGTNESTGSSDDSTQPGSANPTAFLVAAPANIAGIPALDGFGLAALAALLAALGFVAIRRS